MQATLDATRTRRRRKSGRSVSEGQRALEEVILAAGFSPDTLSAWRLRGRVALSVRTRDTIKLQAAEMGVRLEPGIMDNLKRHWRQQR